MANKIHKTADCFIYGFVSILEVQQGTKKMEDSKLAKAHENKLSEKNAAVSSFFCMI